MKTRKGFVSNSSTTSYTCDMCGVSESGWDSVGITEFGFFGCENGHVLCLGHKLDGEELSDEERCAKVIELNKAYLERNPEELERLMESINILEDWWADTGLDSYCVPEVYCPICRFLEISNSDIAAYLLKKTGIAREEAFAVVKASNKRRKKLYDTEYNMYVLQKTGMDISRLPGTLKETFGTYKAFMEWIREK